MAPRGLDSESARAQILQVAGALLCRRMTEIDYREVARLSGVTPALVQHWFPTPEALVSAVVESLLPEPSTLEAVAAQARHDPPPEALRRLARFLIDFFESGDGQMLLRIVAQEGWSVPESGRVFWEGFIRRVVAAVAAYFVEHRGRRGNRGVDAAVAANAFVGAIIGFALTRRLHPGGPVALLPADRMAAGVVEAFHPKLLS